MRNEELRALVSDGLSLDICRSELLHQSTFFLRSGLLVFFPVGATAVLVTMDFSHHLVNVVYTEPLLLIPNCSFRFFDGGRSVLLIRR